MRQVTCEILLRALVAVGCFGAFLASDPFFAQHIQELLYGRGDTTILVHVLLAIFKITMEYPLIDILGAEALSLEPAA